MARNDPLKGFGTRIPTPQSEKARPEQVKNNAGGYVFQISPEQDLLRFLILGTTTGSYYASQRKLTKDAVDRLLPALDNDPTLVDRIWEVSLNGRAPRQDQTLFALAAAAASSNDVTRAKALSYVSDICRTGTMLFQFNSYVEQFRGRGQGLNRAVRKWYLDKPVDSLAYQAIKYRQREGWSHRDLLRLAKPRPESQDRQSLFRWMVGKEVEFSESLPAMVRGFEAAQKASSAREWVQVLHEYPRLPWEALPTQALTEASVWEALLPTLPLTATMRNLGRLTRLGVVSPMGQGTKEVVAKLRGDVTKARLHPVNILVAWFTYRQGHGVKGGDTWMPVPQVTDALQEAFYAAFGNVVPAEKRTLIALDVSGSMGYQSIPNMPITAREAAAALSMVTVRTEPEYFVGGFSRGFVGLPISAGSSLDSVLATTRDLPFDTTDCAKPMLFAMKNNLEVDTFMVVTDNETWSGAIHPFQALEQYRQKTGIPARLVVVGMTATEFSIANPKDTGMIDVVGFDTATPNIISGFSRGDF
jgi:60 kDa SS-A/Ro ribonucleoprotein